MPPSRLLKRLESFIGRKDYLEQIEAAFTKENKHVIILSSFPGTGKSSLANEIGHRLNESSLNQFVYWMRSDENNLDAEFRLYALDLKVVSEEEYAKKPTEYIIDQIAMKLRSKHMNEKFLFILDNCDSIKNASRCIDLIVKIMMTNSK